MTNIYKIVNDVNNKVYIGKSSRSLDVRWNEHLTDCHNPQKCCRPLYSAINKYGEEHFHIELIEECDDFDGNEREMFWIQQYNSHNVGYNATVGGDGWISGSHRKLIDDQMIAEEYLSGKTVKTIANEQNLSYKTVKKSLTESGIAIRGSSSVVYKGKFPVGMYDTDGTLINTFRSVKDAGKFIGKDDRNIGRCCRGYGKTAYGFVWKYLK